MAPASNKCFYVGRPPVRPASWDFTQLFGPISELCKAFVTFALIERNSNRLPSALEQPVASSARRKHRSFVRPNLAPLDGQELLNHLSGGLFADQRNLLRLSEHSLGHLRAPSVSG